MVTVPKWVTKSFLQDALNKYFRNGNIHIFDYSISAAIPIGENFTSDLLRITITFATDGEHKRHNLSVIAKCSPDNEMLLNYIETMRLFEQEIDVYTEVFPAIKHILENNPGVLEDISAKCVNFIKDPESAIILEDLTAQGFKMQPRRKGLDLQHSLLAVEKLAYFHATTAAVFEKCPALISKYDLGIYWKNDFTVRWITTGFKELAVACANWPGCEKYSAKLKRMQSKVTEKAFASARRNPDELNVLNHGDAWINNFMYLYNAEGTPVDFRLVDFQVAIHSSPALDFNYFWATSPNLEVRHQHFDTILNHYFRKLSSTLAKVEYPSGKIPNLEQFRKTLNSRAFYGLTAAVTVLPLVAASKRDDATFDDLFDENGTKDGFRYHAYNNERYSKYMQYLLQFYDNLGIMG